MRLPLVTGTWTSRPLVLSKVTLVLTSGLTSSLTPPSLVAGLGLSLMTFSTSPSVLDFLTTPSELLTVTLGFLFLGGLSLHLNHLIASCVANYDWPFGTLPFGLFGSNLDTRDLQTYPRTYSGHF